MTKLTDREITYLIHQVKGDWNYPKETVGQMAARWGVTKRRLRQLLQTYRNTGAVPRLNLKRRPPGPPLTSEEKRLIEEEWKQAHRGATKVYKALLKRGVKIPKMKIYRFLKSSGRVIPNPRKQRQRSRCRYERKHSGSLLHTDYHQTSENHPHVLLYEDDASRNVLAGGEFAEETTEHAVEVLEEALKEAESWDLTIEAVNTDRGSQFYCSEREGAVRGESGFERFLREKGVRHIVSRVKNPQTNGKLERLWAEYDRHRWRFATLPEFIRWYNDQIHDALGYLETPKEAFQRKLPAETLLGLHLRLVEKSA